MHQSATDAVHADPGDAQLVDARHALPAIRALPAAATASTLRAVVAAHVESAVPASEDARPAAVPQARVPRALVRPVPAECHRPA